MANVASNPLLWKDNANNTPPQWWNGTAYVIDDASRNGVPQNILMLNETPSAGDTFGINFQNFVNTPLNPGFTSFLGIYNGATLLQEFSLDSLNGPTAYTYTFAGTENDFNIQAWSNASGGSKVNTYGADFSLTPISPIPPVAPDETLIVAANSDSDDNAITPVITDNGSPVTPDYLTIITQPAHGTATTNGATLYYEPDPHYSCCDSFTYTATYQGVVSNVATVDLTVFNSYNCECEDEFPTDQLQTLQRRILVRLGMAAMPTPPPGMAELINDFINSAQKMLYRTYTAIWTTRFFTWKLTPGDRFFCISSNIDLDSATYTLDPRRVEWVGISKGDNVWQPLFEGIDPTIYSPKYKGVPCRYEIRQCIEIWPAAQDTCWYLRIKGNFGLLPLVNPTDVTTIDPEAIFLYALANAKAHYQQADASIYMTQAETYIGKLVAGNHPTRRMWPGGGVIRNAIPPRRVP